MNILRRTDKRTVIHLLDGSMGLSLCKKQTLGGDWFSERLFGKFIDIPENRRCIHCERIFTKDKTKQHLSKNQVELAKLEKWNKHSGIKGDK